MSRVHDNNAGNALPCLMKIKRRRWALIFMLEVVSLGTAQIDRPTLGNKGASEMFLVPNGYELVV